MESEKEFNIAKIKNFTDAFAFLMANRHKQNDVIKEMAEHERKTNSIEYTDLGLSICNSELNDMSKQEDPLNLDKLIDKSMSRDRPTKRCAIANLQTGSSNSSFSKNIEHGQKDEKKSVKFSSPDFNAFQWLMSNRSRSKESNNGDMLKDCDNDFDNSEIDVYTGMNNQQRSRPSSTITVINSEKSLPSKISVGQDNSPNGLRLTLINDTEEIDIEETFKEEISECGLKKSKSLRKSSNNKLRRKKMDAKNKQKTAIINETEEANGAISHNDLHNIIGCNENNVEMLEQSPGIAKFFLSSGAMIKEGPSTDKLECKIVSYADSNKSSRKSNNAKVIPQNNKALKLKWFKEKRSKVGHSNDDSILEIKNVLVSPSKELPSIENANSMECSTLEIKNANYTIFHKSKHYAKGTTESENNKENKKHKKKKVKSDIKVFEVNNSEKIEIKEEECMTNKVINNRTCSIKNNKLADSLNVKINKTKTQCSNLRSVRKEAHNIISSPLPNDSSASSILKKLSPEFIEISSPPKNKLFKIFNKMDLSTTKDINLCNEQVQVPYLDNSITVIVDDASEQSVTGINKADGNNGLRRSSRSIKKPMILTCDSFCEDNKSPTGKRNKIKSGNCSNTPERPPKLIKQKKLSKSFILSSLEDDDDECWDIFKKSPGTKKLSSLNKKKTNVSNDKHKHPAQGSKDTPSDDDDSIEIIALDVTSEDNTVPNSGKRKMANYPVKAFAPIFKIKIQPSMEDLEKQKARDNFLFSESPLTDSMKHAFVESDDEDSYTPLPTYSHIQQKDEDNFWNLQHPQNCYFKDSMLNSSTCWLPTKENFEWKNITSPVDASPELFIQEVPLLTSTCMFHIISLLNTESPSLKLFTFFKELLRIKKDSLEVYYKDAPKNSPQELIFKNDTKRKRKLKSLSRSKRRKLSQGEKDVHEEIPLWHRWNPFSWNQVFSPSRVEFFIGEVSNVREMEEWFSFWKEKTEKLCSHNSNPWKASSGANSDYSDTNDSESSYSNTMLLIGPPGVGKSALVYSLAQQFGFKVLEINASSQRQGKQVMSQLLEATQSHTVSSKSNNGNLDLKSGLNQKPSESQNLVEGSKTKALILIEDIDIVFEDSDEGFISAINTLMATTKRPIVLTLEHDSTNTTAKLKEKYEKFILNPPMSSKIARHLQIMCLVDGLFVNYDEIKLLVEINNNDIRKSIQDLQFWLISGPTNMMTTTIKFNTDNCKGICDTLFVNEELQATFDVPMACDCLWVQSTFRGAAYDNISSCFDWKLISPNISFLFNFPSTSRKEKSLVYPLHKDDHCVQIAKRQHQINNELFEFDTPPKKKTLNVTSPKVDERTACVNGAIVSKEESALVSECLTQMLRLHSTLSDLDILESGFGKISETYYVTKRRSRFAYSYSGLESPHSAFSNYSSLLNHTDMLQVISKNILLSTTNAVQEHIKTLVDAKELSIERETSTLVLHPHVYTESNLEPLLKIQEKLENFCTLNTMANRQGLYLDYFPYMRDFARSDQLSEVLHKLKQQRRYLSQMKQLGLFLTTQELNVMCNIFKNS